jgi:predicted KAP-like P-loop ATPase
MSHAPERLPLSADRPLADAGHDRLGHARFAAHVAACVAELTAESPVIGIHGAPGSGRTSALNMVCQHLASAGVAVVEVNPWVLGPELEDTLARHLDKAAGRRLVVAMDDVDRLDDGERAALARLVERVGAVPGAVYLLVLDRDGLGPVTLGRLVKVPFDLPLPDGDSLNQLLLERLQQVLAESPSANVVDEAHWEQIFRPGIERLVRTPRDVALLANALRVTYPRVSLEVNAADFIAIQAIRIFLPRLYDTIRRNPAKFAGQVRTVAVAGAPLEDREFHDAWSDALPAHVDGEAVRTLVLRLFPTVPEFPGTVTQRDSSGSGLRRLLRVGAREIFPVYFQLAVPERAVSHVELSAVLASLGDRDAFAGTLLEAAGQRDAAGASHARTLLSRLAEEVSAADPAVVPTAVEALLGTGDELARQDPATPAQVVKLVIALLRRIEETARHSLLDGLVATCPAPAALSVQVGELGREHGRHGGARREVLRTLTEPHVDALEQRVVERLREVAAAGAMATLPQLSEVLTLWLGWDRAECTRWVARAVQDDDVLIRLLNAFMVNARGGPQIDLERLSVLVNPALIAPAVRRLPADTRLGGGAAAVSAFLAAVEPADEAQAV